MTKHTIPPAGGAMPAEGPADAAASKPALSALIDRHRAAVAARARIEDALSDCDLAEDAWNAVDAAAESILFEICSYRCSTLEEVASKVQHVAGLNILGFEPEISKVFFASFAVVEERKAPEPIAEKPEPIYAARREPREQAQRDAAAERKAAPDGQLADKTAGQLRAEAAALLANAAALESLESYGRKVQADRADTIN